MKRPGKLAEMIAKKAFDAPQFQQSWAVHMQAFGPILAPAYPDCFTAKVHLTNILNKISRRDVEGAKATMQTLLQSCGCETSEEKALLAFLQGLCCEAVGDQMHMFALYTQAGYHHHRFYLPHLKCARFAHESGQLDVALAEYSKALPLIRELPEGPARTKLLGGALTNTASCLTYMHRYQDAEALLKEARQHGPVARIETVEAVLLAAMDREEEMEACLVALAEADDPAYDHILDLVTGIINGQDPHFTAQPVNEEAVAAFWQWFSENVEHLLALFNQQDEELPEEFVDLVREHIEPCFPFEHPPVELGSTRDEVPPEVIFFTNSFSRSVNAGYGTIIEACPADVASRWSFTAERG